MTTRLDSLARIVIAALLACTIGHAEEPRADLPPEIGLPKSELRPAPHPDADAIRSGVTDWAALVDAAWGPSTWTSEQRASIFNEFWETIDAEFACFQGIPDNWTALKAQYEAEATAPTISQGRFYAILCQMSMALRDGHTWVTDDQVAWTLPAPGVPIFWRQVWGDLDRLGAAVAPEADGTALVLQVAPDHPLGLEPGDRILGYDGRAWDQLADELLHVEALPVSGGAFMSDPEGFNYVKMGSVGANWHLFSTIDVLKHATGEVQHLDTSSMIGYDGTLWWTDQFEIPGIPRPDLKSSQVTWGILPGTNIGYINAAAWLAGSDPQWYGAINSLTQLMDTDGLIIDFRFNIGGQMSRANAGLSLLFDETVETIDFVLRCGPGHLDLCSQNDSHSYDIVGNPAAGYFRPIAVLNGPATFSSGDQNSLRMDFHRRAASFGRSTSTTFNGPDLVAWSDPAVAEAYFGRYCVGDAYLLTDPTEYLTHDERYVDCPVWWEEDDVLEGRDTVLEAAIEWIEGGGADADGDHRRGRCDNCPNVVNPAQTDTDLDGSGDACDCALTDDRIYPGAPEVNDGVDNQCAGDSGFGLVDETDGRSGFLNASNKSEYGWIAQPGAAAYEVARSSVPDFASDCVFLPATGEAMRIDPDIPAPGSAYFYLNRPSAPILGSWGRTSAGVERTLACGASS